VNDADYSRVRATISDESAPLMDRVAAVEEAVSSSGLPVAQRVALLRACLASTDEAVREVGVRALGAGRSPHVTALLRGLLQDESEVVRAAALAQLASRQDPIAYETCAHWLCHGTPALRQAARAAAFRLPGEQAVGLFEILWQSSDLGDDERMAVAVGLYRWDNRIGEAFLLRRLPGEQPISQAFIAATLAPQGHPAALDVIERLAGDRTLGAEERRSIRFVIWGGLGLTIPHDAPDDEWAIAVLAWVEHRRSQGGTA
jgi:hypothetical protein